MSDLDKMSCGDEPRDSWYYHEVSRGDFLMVTKKAHHALATFKY